MLAIDLRTALVALCGCACPATPGGGDPASPAPIGATEVGATIRSPHFQIRASRPKECPAPSPALRNAETRLLGVELTLEPTTDIQVPANPYYARLVDTDHEVHEATLGGCGAPLAPPLPARGHAARGWIVFELPRSARAATLLYAPELVGAPATELAIDLGR